MITARPAFVAARFRRPAGPLTLLWLAALLFAFLYTHAAGADSASAHVTRGAAAVPHLALAEAGGGHPHDLGTADGRGDGHDDAHPAESCASGHPQQSFDLPGPDVNPLAERTATLASSTRESWARPASAGLPSLRSSLSSVVQQV